MFAFDVSCFWYQRKDIAEIEKILSEYFKNICGWFVNKKLSIHFGDDKIKSIKSIKIQKNKHLGCVLDESMSGEPTPLKFINKINEKLKFLYRKNKFLTPELRRMLCNALIWPHFDYAHSVSYPNLTKKKKINFQVFQ